MNNSLTWLLIPIVALSSSCAIFAPDERTELNNNLPEKFTLYSEEIPDTENRWWESFQSPELNALIEEALTNSPSIQQSWARLAQAEATASKIGADRYPTLKYDGDARATRNSISDTTIENYSLGLNASYELDLWGRIKSETEAAALDRYASREQLNTAAITLSSQVTFNWLGIVAQRLQTDVIKQQLEANKTSLELIELRFRKSLSSALDVYQQRQTVAATESRIPAAELREELAFNTLAVLLGRADFQTLRISETQLPILNKLPAIGLPADVLANRPDVRQAGLKLQAADWNVSAARAERLPAIRLTASAEYANSELSDLFDDWFANLAGSITGPIFEGGRRKAEVERTRAVVDERLAAYRETVINAIKEVEDALVSEQKQHDYIALLDIRLEAARKSYEESVNRYRNGLVEYTTVLIQLNTLQGLERDRVEAQFDLLRYRIDLYRALGGTWPNELSTPN
jgi:NodT family efflux transporter outer membrane factor (OMF) lipoprotein